MTAFHALTGLHRELGRVFDDRPLYRYTPESSETSSWTPQVDIKEDESGFTVIADVPGVDPANVDITLDNNVLTIRGERESETNGLRRRERSRGSFLRQFTLPESVDESGVKASATNGVLQVTIPRSTKAKPLSITVEGE